MNIYLDNAATTRCLPEAAEACSHVLTECYGNPSSLHTMGMNAENYLKDCRKTIASTLKTSPKEIVFTSGGTESNNLAIWGSARARKRRGRHIITTMIEHPSVYNTFAALSDEEWDVTYLPVDSNGVLSLEVLEKSLREDTVLVSVMHVNNEIGTIEPVEEIAKLIHRLSPKALFHVDAIQSYGKLPLYPGSIGIDLLSVSGHKLHAPKGSGFLYINEKAHILPLLYGGGQEGTMRSGTENVPAIAGLDVAVQEVFKDQSSNTDRMYSLRHELIRRLSRIDGISLNGYKDERSAPHIVSLTIEGVRAEVMLHALEAKGIFVSSGSACSSNRPSVSRTLTAIGLKGDALENTIRLSFSIHTTPEEIADAADAIEEQAALLSRFKRK